MPDAADGHEPGSRRGGDQWGHRSGRRHVVLSGAAAVVMITNTVVMWSDGVGTWWADRSGDDGGWAVPVVGRLLALRPDVGDADLHAVAWAVAAFLVVMAGRRGTRSMWAMRAIGAVWAWSVVVESLQPVVSHTRAFEVIDVVGNSVGVVVGAALALWWRARAR